MLGLIVAAASNDITVNLTTWAAIVGALLPPVAGLIQHQKWPPYVQGVIFGALVIVCSVIYTAIKFDPWSWAGWRGAMLAMFAWAIGTFFTFWKPSGIVDKARAVPVTGDGSAPARRSRTSK